MISRLAIFHSLAASLMVVMLSACFGEGGGSGGTSSTPQSGATNNSANGSACLGIVNGTDAADASEPAVVHLIRDTGNGQWSSCTGTFISATAVITAGHCTGASNNKISIINGSITPDLSSLSASQIVGKLGGVSGVSLFNLGYTEEDSTDSAGNWTPSINDVAIVMFPPGNAPAIMSIARNRPPVGSKVTLVGYGDSTFQDANQDYAYQKRTGTNVVINAPSFDAQDATVLEVGGQTASESAGAKGAAAIGTFGDSGGPMVVNGQITATFRSQTWHGVGGTTTPPNSYYDQFIDINSPQTQRLIATANNVGQADIPPPTDAAPASNGNSGGAGGCSH